MPNILPFSSPPTLSSVLNQLARPSSINTLALPPRSLPSDLKPIVTKLSQAKKAIDDGDTKNAGPISWPDLMYLAVRVRVSPTAMV
eukprot:182184-Chlamydomonas_euryale.AAC.2